MAFSFQNIKYGWLALTGIVLTGTTIYVVNNTRHQVKQIDIIPIVLGVYERCLATQYATNPLYYVDPPSFVRNWINTNGAGGYVTNAVTNAIGWHVDRSMMVELDAKIKALVHYYVDTNTVYNGTTNISMLTVTGLWASLGIGDGTNQFTSVPCWTNQAQTNWVVNYTNAQGGGYLGGTNFIFSSTTNFDGATYTIRNYFTLLYAQGIINSQICYTANQETVVWVVTNVDMGVTHVLNSSATNDIFYPLPNMRYTYFVYPSPNQGVYMSNFPSFVSQTTNVATYGAYPWQVYKEDLEERYKVLNALSIYKLPEPKANYSLYQGSGLTTSSWADAVSSATTNFQLLLTYTNETIDFHCSYYGELTFGEYSAGPLTVKIDKFFIDHIFPTNVPHKTSIFMRGTLHTAVLYGTFYNNGLVAIEDLFALLYEQPTWSEEITNNISFSYGISTIPAVCAEPTEEVPADVRGFFAGLFAEDWIAVAAFNFQYCTNAYWD